MAGMLEALLGLGWAALLQGKGDQRQGWAQDVQGATHPRTEGHVTWNRKARPGHTGQSLEQVSASGMRNRVSLLEGRSKGQSSPEPARWGGRHIPSARPPGTGELGPVPRPVSAGEAVLGEGDLSPGTRVLLVRGPPGHRTPWEVRGGKGRGAASSLGAPKVTQLQEEPPLEPPEGQDGARREFTWAVSGPVCGPSLQQPQETNAWPTRLQKLPCSQPFGSPGRAQ